MARGWSHRRRMVAALLLLAAAPLCTAAELTALSGEQLRAGSFRWEGEPVGPLSIVVSRSRQRAYVYSGGQLIGVSTVSTGKPGHRTPLGEFTILEKQVRHRSNKYSNAPMPFMQRLTWDGVAMHAGRLPGYPASHGCIRLPWGFARKLFAATALGAVVEVTDGGPALPRVEMAAARPAPRTPAAPAAPPAVELAAATPPLRFAPVPEPAPVVTARPPRPEPARFQLASAESIRPPRASWYEQSAEDYVTWGSSVPGRSRPTGTQ